MQYNVFVKKAGQTLVVDFDKYPAHIQQHIIEYGLKQKFNDVHSGEETAETAWGLVQNLQERLLLGEIAKRVGSGNPVETRLKGILRKLMVGATGKKAAEVNKLTTAELVTAIATATGKNADAITKHYTSIAEAQVAKERQENAALLAGIADIEA